MHDGALRVIDLATGEDTVVAQEDGVTFGLAEFVAAEEMGRSRGYWWSPDGSRLLVARVDESAVARWHIADPANPDTAPGEVAYPAAGTAERRRVAAARHPARPPSHARGASASAEVTGWDRAASLTWSTRPGTTTC